MTYHCQMGLILCLLVPAGFSCIIVPTGRASLLLLLIGFSLQLLPHQRSGYLPNRAAAYNTSRCRADGAHGLFCVLRRREQRRKDMPVAMNLWCRS